NTRLPNQPLPTGHMHLCTFILIDCPGRERIHFEQSETLKTAKERAMDSKKASRRKFLKGGAAAAAAGALQSAGAQTPAPAKRSLKDEVAYGERSPYVTSVRVAVLERASPDEYGLTFHVLSPLQDSVGIITPSSLHFVGTHRGAIVPDIPPDDYKFLLHGMVDRPLEFTLEELKRFPSVSHVHFLECLGNRAKVDHKTVQQTTGLTSCA